MIGEVLNDYRIVRKLGEGGMGVVYQAEHTTIGSPACVKVLRPDMSARREVVIRFFNEARAAAVIDNPGIVKVFHFGHGVFKMDDGEPSPCAYFIMEYLSGTSLSDKLANERLAPEMAIAITKQIARTLGAAHDKGIVHRDLKPDNTFLVPDPEVPGGVRVKVLDFGIAKLSDEVATGQRTATGMMMGTAAYMSPEQCRNAGGVDDRADIYSLGCMLYEMAVGQRPFGSITASGELVAAHQYRDPAAPRSLAPSVSEHLEAVIVHMLAKQPVDRYQSMAEVIEDLERVARGDAPVLASRSAPAERPITQLARPKPGGTTPAEAAPRPTTLGSAASQAVATRPMPRRTAPLALAGALAATAITMVVIVSTRGPVSSRNARTPEDPPTSASTGTFGSPAPVAPAPTPSPATVVAVDAGVPVSAPTMEATVAPAPKPKPEATTKPKRDDRKRKKATPTEPATETPPDEDDEDRVMLPK